HHVAGVGDAARGRESSEGRVAGGALVRREWQRRTPPTRRETVAVPVRALPAAGRAAASPLRGRRVVARRLEAARSALGVRSASARSDGRDRKGGLGGRRPPRLRRSLVP